MTYSTKVLEHFANPRNVGELDDADGIGEAGGAKCGDLMRLYIKVRDNVISDVSFKTFGCAAAIAASSVTTELLKGRTLEAAVKLTNDEVNEALDGLPEEKLHCSVLAEQAVKSAVEDYRKKHGTRPENGADNRYE